MKQKAKDINTTLWIFALVIFSIGLANLLLVHVVPGMIFIIASLLFLPPVNSMTKDNLNISIPFSIQIILFIVLIWFTLGISDLGELMGL